MKRAAALGTLAATVFLAAAMLVAACSRGPSSNDTASRFLPFDANQPSAYDDTTQAFPHLIFTDGRVSLNDRCPVRKVKLNRRLPPVFVNGHPVGFC